jgi:2'-5' RNA ligase
MLPSPGTASVTRTTLFLAFLPTAEIQRTITGLCDVLRRAHRLHGHVMPADRLHMTLMPVFDPLRSRQDMIADLAEIAADIRHDPVPLAFDTAISFRSGDRYPLVLAGGRPAPASDFRRMLAGRLRREGFAVDPGFTAHVTMLWADRRVADYPIAPIAWRAHELVLVESARGRHVHLARWALG